MKTLPNSYAETLYFQSDLIPKDPRFNSGIQIKFQCIISEYHHIITTLN